MLVRSQLALPLAAVTCVVSCELVIGIDPRAELTPSSTSITASGSGGAGGAGGSAVTAVTSSTGVGGSGGGCPSNMGPTCPGDDAYSTLILAAGPLGYWRLNDPMGAMPNATDSACANPHHGFFAGAGNVNLELEVPGVAGDTAMEFHGFDNEHISLGAVPDFDFTDCDSFSLEVWLKPSAIVVNRRRILEHMIYSTDAPLNIDQGYRLVTENGNIQFDRFIENTPYTAQLGGTLSTDVWTHVVATYEANAELSTLYVNGAVGLEVLSPRGDTSNAAAIRIGATSGGSSCFEGTIDEFAIYGYALTPTQVSAHCEAAARVTCQ